MDIPDRNRNNFKFALGEINMVKGSLETRLKGVMDVSERAGLQYNIASLERAIDYINNGLEEPNGEITDPGGTEGET